MGMLVFPHLRDEKGNTRGIVIIISLFFFFSLNIIISVVFFFAKYNY